MHFLLHDPYGMMIRSSLRAAACSALGVLAVAVLLVGCDASNPTQRSSIEVGFQTVGLSSSTQAQAKATGDSLVVSGSNGTLGPEMIRHLHLQDLVEDRLQQSRESAVSAQQVLDLLVAYGNLKSSRR